MTLYKKIGRRYHPIAEYSPEITDSLPEGAHLVVVAPGVKMWTYRVAPDTAGLRVIIQQHRDEIIEAIRNASVVQPWPGSKRKQLKAWRAYCDVMGEDAELWISKAAAADILAALEEAIAG